MVATERKREQMGPLVSTLYSYFCITVAKISNSYSLKKERPIWWNPLNRRKEDPARNWKSSQHSTTVTLLGYYNSPYVLNLIPIPTDKCSNHLSSKRSVFIANGTHQRKPQPDTKQKPTGDWNPNPMDKSTSYLLHPLLNANVFFPLPVLMTTLLSSLNNIVSLWKLSLERSHIMMLVNRPTTMTLS